MGSVPTREEIICKLQELDKRELDLNLRLKELQTQLNGMVPESEKIKVNDKLTPEFQCLNNYGEQAGRLDDLDEIGSRKSKKKTGKKKKK